MDYRGAGVDRRRAERALQGIARQAARTRRAEVRGETGAFAGAFALPEGYRRPLLLAGADGVGSKLLLLQRLARHRVAGRDLVAMNVNDLLAQGAEPLFFLDYVSSGHLDPEAVVETAAGMADACVEVGCALLGGETAEVPDLLAAGATELAGFAVGVCEQDALIDGRGSRAGDAILGCAASGPHSNGFSLIRQVLRRAGVQSADGTLETGYTPAGWRRPLLDALLEPTRLYVRAVRAVLPDGHVRGMAHVTGGGLPGNLPRALPRGLGARLDAAAWKPPPVFDWIAGAGGVDRREMLHTFNMGVGFVLIVDAAHVDDVREQLAGALDAPVWVIGEVVRGGGVTGLW